MASNTLITGGKIDLEINKIINTRNESFRKYNYKFILHTKELDINIDLIETFEVMRNYNASLCDYALASFKMYGDTFIKKVYPYRDNLEFSVILVPIDTTLESITTRYRFVLSNNNSGIEASRYTKMSSTELAKTDMFNVTGQCLLREFEGLKGLYVDGIYKDITVKDLILAVMKNEFNKVQINGNALEVNINIEEVDNENIYKHVIIPTGINLLDLPTYLQNSNYGVYNNGIGTYLQIYNNKYYLFIYPLFDTKLYESSKRKVIIYYSNTERYSAIENNYMLDGDIVNILVTGKLVNIDNGENEFINKGNILTTTNPYNVLNKNITIEDEDVLVTKDVNLKSISIKERRDGVEKTQFYNQEVNQFKLRSIYNRNTLSIYQFEWHYCDIDVIYPGMPCELVYEDSDYGIIRLTGIIQVFYYRYSHRARTTSAVVNIMVQNPNFYSKKENKDI